MRHFFHAVFLPSLDKDTHAFSSDATFASVVLTLTGSPPRCGASSSPHKVFRPCGGPMCKSALTASSSLAYASMPASSSLPSSDFPSPKSPVEFLRGRNAVGGSAAKMAGWRLPMNRAMPYGIYARKNRMCSCQAKVLILHIYFYRCSPQSRPLARGAVGSPHRAGTAAPRT